MIITEKKTLYGREFIHTYSDSGYQIKQDGTGIVYDDAIDPVDSGRTYTETDEPIAEYITDETEAKARAYDILMGGE